MRSDGTGAVGLCKVSLVMRMPTLDDNKAPCRKETVMLRDTLKDDLPLSIIVSSLVIGIIFAAASLYLNGLGALLIG